MGSFVEMLDTRGSLVSRAQDLYHSAMSHSDDKTRGWPLVGPPLPMLSIVFLYMALCVLGPRAMRGRPALELKGPIKVYNVFMILINLYMTIEFVAVALRANYSWLCQPPDHSTHDPLTLRHSTVIYLYYLSKIVELSDTVFFILRKKFQHLSFLQIYHHSSMVIFIWSIVTFVPSGDSFFPILCNCIIHVIMYTYYLLASLGPSYHKYLWWKRHLTKMQLVQFVTIIAHSLLAIYIGCTDRFFNGFQIFLISYEFSFVLLFSNFYVQAYHRKKQQQHQRELEEDSTPAGRKMALHKEE